MVIITASWREDHARFELGQLLATPNALSRLTGKEIIDALHRHASGDWGCLDKDDWNQNDRALEDGARIFSAYKSHAGEKFWIITEADRSVTTILLPEDY